jgi:hypothetical protein
MGSIPTHLGHLLVDRQSWNTHYKPKLDPSTPGRFPSGSDLDKAVKIWTDPHRSTICVGWAGSLFGSLRDWMGMENIALVPYDDPAWFQEMVTTLADLAVAMLSRVFAAGAHLDAISFWEDMCFNSGPLLSPQFFKEFLVPQYRRITDLARRHGTDVIWVDCDGKIDDLLPLWLEAKKPGMYWGDSAQYSGTGFAKMFFKVKAVSPSAFAAWAKSVHATASPMTSQDYQGLLKHNTMGVVAYGAYPKDTFPTVASGFTLTGKGMYMTMHDQQGRIVYIPMTSSKP